MQGDSAAWNKARITSELSADKYSIYNGCNAIVLAAQVLHAIGWGERKD